MQFSHLFTALAVAMTATALPAGGENVDMLAPRTEKPVPSCTNNQQPVCCNSIPLVGNLLCAVSILGGTCEGSTYCCSTTAAPGTVINLQFLNCLHIG